MASGRTLRISSRSSLNASATDAIQNFLNRSFRTCSSCCPDPATPFRGKNGGIGAGGGVGDSDRRAACLRAASEAACGESCLVGSAAESLSESESESDEEGEEEDGASLGSGCGFLAAFTGTRTTA